MDRHCPQAAVSHFIAVETNNCQSLCHLVGRFKPHFPKICGILLDCQHVW